MSLKFVTGNLFESGCDALVNTVNTVGVMGAGVALAFKKQFPNNYFSYRDACSEGRVIVGKMFITKAQYLDKEILIVNFPTKKDWRNPSTMDYVNAGLISLASGLKTSGIKSIAIPPLGCGNGGLDWPDVKELIIHHLGDIKNIDILVYEPPA